MTTNNKNIDKQGKKLLNVPNLRFPEFEGEWEKTKLSDITQRVSRKNKSIVSDRPLTISAQFGLIDQRDFFNKVVASENLEGYYLLKKGEFAYNKSYSNEHPWGVVKRLDLYEEGALSTLYICFECKKANSDWLVHYFDSPKWNKQISEIAVEGARNHGLLNVSIEDFFKTYHFIPKTGKEQEKLANFLTLIDNRIATQNRIINKLQSLMKGLAEHLTAFTPNTKIADCLNCHSSILQENQVKNEGKYKVYGANGICGYNDSPAILEDAILIVKDGSGVGNVSYASGEYSVIGTSNYLTAKSGYSLKYLYFCLMIFNFVPYRTGMAIPHIYFKDYGKALIPCPSLNKQEQIATLLSKIECKIETEKSISESYLRQKRFLLKSMFI